MSTENSIIRPSKLIEIKNDKKKCFNKDKLFFFINISLFSIFIAFYISSVFLFYLTGVFYLSNFNYTIIDNANYSYIEYISDFIFISENKEQEILDMNKSLCNKTYYYKKLTLFNYNDNIFCECTNKNDTTISKDINLCYFMDCKFKKNINKTKNYSIYKWNNNLIYINISRYYINQGINPKTKKCDIQLGYISCGFHENINLVICIRNNSMKCPFKAKNGKNILFNNIDILFDINNINDYILNNNISLLDIFTDIKIKNKKDTNNYTFLFNEEINKFFNENEIGFPSKKKLKIISDKIYIIPNNNNNFLLYDETIINDDNFFRIINFHDLRSENFIIIFLQSFYLVYIAFGKGLIFNIMNMSLLYYLFTNFFQFEYILKDFNDSIFFIIFFFIEILHCPFFLYYTNSFRRLRNKYNEHIWDKNFMKSLKYEKYFLIDNLVLYFMQLLTLILFCSSFLYYYIKKYIKKNKFVEIK